MFHTEFPEPLIHETASGFNTENTEGSGKVGLPWLRVLRQFFFVPSVLKLRCLLAPWRRVAAANQAAFLPSRREIHE